MKRILKNQLIPMLKNRFKSGVMFSFVLALMAFTPRLSPPQVDNQSAPLNGTVVNSTFQAGEELTYKVYYNLNFVWIAAGEVTFKIEDLGQQYHINATGRRDS